VFRQVWQGLDPKVLKAKLDRWDLFEHYEGRFLSLFRKKGGQVTSWAWWL
jgi:hypothetical protein